MAAIKIGNYYITKNDPRFLLREIEDLWEVGKKSNRRVKRLIEIEYILNGLYCDKEVARLREENSNLRKRLINEGIDIYEES